MPEPLLSVVVPLFNEEQALPAFYRELRDALSKVGMPYEIVFVDDGSTDKTAALLQSLHREDPRVGAVLLARNFGHQIALTAGLDAVRGEAVVMLDGDGQHPPELIASMVELWRGGAKIVHGVREETEDIGLAKDLTSATYYWLLNTLSDTKVQPNAADFRLLDRHAVDALRAMKERHRFLRGLIGWLGLPEAVVRFKARRRSAGTSKYTWRKMFRMAFDGIIAFSVKPLRLALWLGLATLALNFAYAGYIVYTYLAGKLLLRGWASMIFLVMFLNSIQLILLGIMGEYLGRMYEEIKARPLYLVHEHLQAREHKPAGARA